jgi:hypothetical protein
MNRLQFSIVSLLGVVTVVGVGCAALVNASHLWAGIVVNAAVFALLAAAVGAVYLRSNFRAFCGGFAIFGWAYFLLTATSMFHLDRWFLTQGANNALYSVLTDAGPGRAPTPALVYNSPGGQAIQVTAAPPGYRPPAMAPQPVTVSYSVMPAPAGSPAGGALPYEAFDRIAHTLWTVVIGTIGGLLALWLSGRNRPPGSGLSSSNRL